MSYWICLGCGQPTEGIDLCQRCPQLKQAVGLHQIMSDDAAKAESGKRSTVYDQGFKAARNYQSKHSNPYQYGTKEANWWEAGWKHKSEEYKV